MTSSSEAGSGMGSPSYHALDMQCKRFLRSRPRFVERRAGGNAAGEIREGNPVVAVRILMDKSDIVRHDQALHQFQA